MPVALAIKRRASGGSGSPSSLKSGELARNEVTGVLYYGQGNDGSGNATSIVPIGWLVASAAQLLASTADLLVSPAGLLAAMAWQGPLTHSSSVSIDPTVSLNVLLGNITSAFAISFSTAIPDGCTCQIRAIVTSGGPHLMQFPTGSVLLGEAFTGTRQISLAASGVYLISVTRMKDNSGTAYNAVSYVKEGG